MKSTDPVIAFYITDGEKRELVSYLREWGEKVGLCYPEMFATDASTHIFKEILDTEHGN